MEALGKDIHIVPAVWPVDLDTAANPGDWISMKGYKHCTILIFIGVTTGTAVVTLDKAANVVGGTTTLAFTRYFMSGVKLKYTGPTGPFTVGEQVDGAGGGQGFVYKDNGDYLLLYTVNATAFVDGETITGATSLNTASADGIGIDEDILLPVTLAAGVNTFTIPAVSNRIYAIPIEADALGEGYDCLQLDIADASAGCIGSAVYILSQQRYAGIPALSAIYD